MTSSFDWNLFPASHFFMFGNRKQLRCVRLSFCFFPELPPTKQHRKRSHGPAQARWSAKRLEVWKARVGGTKGKKGDDPGPPSNAEEPTGYDPRHPGYDAIAMTVPADDPPRAYRPTPKPGVTRPTSGITVHTKPPTTSETSPPTTADALPPTTTTAPESTLGTALLTSTEFSALFDQLEGQYAVPPPGTPELTHRQAERTLDEVLGSPVWELELTCSSIHG